MVAASLRGWGLQGRCGTPFGLPGRDGESDGESDRGLGRFPQNSNRLMAPPLSLSAKDVQSLFL